MPFLIWLCAHNVTVPNLPTRCVRCAEAIKGERYPRSSRPRVSYLMSDSTIDDTIAEAELMLTDSKIKNMVVSNA